MSIRTIFFLLIVAGTADAADPVPPKPERIDAETMAAWKNLGAEFCSINLDSLDFLRSTTDFDIPAGSIPGFIVPSEKIAGLPHVKVPFGLKLLTAS